MKRNLSIFVEYHCTNYRSFVKIKNCDIPSPVVRFNDLNPHEVRFISIELCMRARIYTSKSNYRIMVQVSEDKLSIGKYIKNCNSVEEADDLKNVLPHFLKSMSYELHTYNKFSSQFSFY